MRATVLVGVLLLGTGCDFRPPPDPPPIRAAELSLDALDDADADSTAPSRLRTGPRTQTDDFAIQDTEGGALVRALRLTNIYSDDQRAQEAVYDSMLKADGAVVEMGHRPLAVRRDTSYLVVRYTEMAGWERVPASVWDAARPTVECSHPSRLGDVAPEPDEDGRGRPVPLGVWGRYVMDEAPSPDGNRTAWLSSADAVGTGIMQSPHHTGPFALTITGDSTRTFHLPSYPKYACWSPFGDVVVVPGGVTGPDVWAVAPTR